MNKSSDYENGLRAVAAMRDEDHPFHLGQPLYVKPEIFNHGFDKTIYVAMGFHRGFLRGWLCDAVNADDPTGTPFVIPVDWLTDQDPWKAPGRYTASRQTTKGNWLMCIDGGRA